MTWVADHIGDILWYAGQHTLLAGIPLIIGLIIALPLGWVARRYSKLYGFLIAGSGLLYTIPSLALFILMPLILGTRILDTLNVYVAMTSTRWRCSSGPWRTGSAPSPTRPGRPRSRWGSPGCGDC